MKAVDVVVWQKHNTSRTGAQCRSVIGRIIPRDRVKIAVKEIRNPKWIHYEMDNLRKKQIIFAFFVHCDKIYSFYYNTIIGYVYCEKEDSVIILSVFRRESGVICYAVGKAVLLLRVNSIEIGLWMNCDYIAYFITPCVCLVKPSIEWLM